MQNHTGDISLQTSQSRNAIYRELFAQNRLTVRTHLKSLLFSHYVALLYQCRRRYEIILGLVYASLEGEVSENGNIADHGVEIAGALTTLGLLKVVVREFGYGREDPDYVFGAGVDMLDLVLVNSLHLFGDQSGYLVLAD